MVIKRNGLKVKFDKEKIQNAINQAFDSCQDENQLPLEVINTISTNIALDIFNAFNNGHDDVSVEDIQDYVEYKLMQTNYKNVAKSYITYRYKRAMVRDKYSEFMSAIEEKLNATNVANQNANVDEYSFGGRMGEASRLMAKRFALEEILSPMARNNHENNRIYVHDLDNYCLGDHNCLSIPFDSLLANGFNTRQTDVRAAQSVNTAFQLVAVIFQLQSLQQFGGVSSTHIDWTMVPYVRKSFYKHFMDGLKYVEMFLPRENMFNDSMSIDDDNYKSHQRAYNYAFDMTKKEIKQASEGLFHNLNTLQSRSGNQLPFTSLNYGTCTLTEGRLITKAILNTSIAGIGKNKKTSVFPCQIFQCKKGINRKPADPNYDLFKLALESTAKRLYPNYVNCDFSAQQNWIKFDRDNKRKKIESLTDEEKNILIQRIKDNPELENILLLKIVDNNLQVIDEELPIEIMSTMGKCKCSSCKILMNRYQRVCK